MLYAVLCYGSEAVVMSKTKEQEDELMGRLRAVNEKLVAEGKLGPSARLMPTTAATTVRIGKQLAVMDGPFAETKEQLLGFYVLDCDTFAEALEATRRLAAERDSGALELRPLRHWSPGLPLR